MSHRIRFIPLCLLLLAVSACGGGGGDSQTTTPTPPTPPTPPAPTNVLSGNYVVTSYTIGLAPGFAHTSSWGSAATDGAGNISVSGSINSGGTISALGTTTYQITSSSGTVALSLGGAEVLRGGIADDGSVATLASVGNGEGTALVVMIRQDPGTSLATLDGGYVATGISADGVILGERTYDGTGGLVSGLLFNVGAGPVAPGGLANYVYTMGTTGVSEQADMSVAWDQFSGGATANGELGTWAGGSNPSSPSFAPHLHVDVEHDTTATVADLAGNYHIAGFVSLGSSPIAIHGLLTMDGAGTFSGPIVPHSGGTVGTAVTESGTLAIGPSGLIMNRAGQPVANHVGAISPSGRYMAFAGDNTTGGDLILWVLVRE